MQMYPTSCYKIRNNLWSESYFFLSFFLFRKTFRDSKIPRNNSLPTKARYNYILRDPTDANRNFSSPLFYLHFHPESFAEPDSRQLSFVTRHCRPSLFRGCWSGAQWPPPTRKWSTTATTKTMIRSELTGVVKWIVYKLQVTGCTRSDSTSLFLQYMRTNNFR